MIPGMSRTVTIACASAFWGDTPLAVGQILRTPQLDYIVFDYLAEVTMTLLAKARSKNPDAGYATDFLGDVVEAHLPEILRRGIRLVSNAGGMNPTALKAKVVEAAARQGLNPRVVCVLGDDVLAHAPAGSASANAYLGAPGIVAALAAGADIVITGRVVDTAVVLGPLVHEFGWGWDEYDKLSQGSLAGHIVECGTQCTGGNFTDWSAVPSRHDVGFPILVCHPDGRFQITKPPGTGGLVSPGTVAEQVVYEIGDPRFFLLPDVTCDWSQVELRPLATDVVEVSGAQGFSPSTTYKVCATRVQGYKLSATAFIGGGDAVAKARSVGEALLERCARELIKRQLPPWDETRLEALGGGEEALLRLSAAHASAAALDILSKEVAPAATSLAPGMSNMLGGRPSPTPRVKLECFLLPKSTVPVTLDDGTAVSVPPGEERQPPGQDARSATTSVVGVPTPLHRVALARSGDKGNHANIGLIARRPELVPLLRSQVTTERVAAHFAGEFEVGVPAKVERWELPGLHAFNFLLHDCLGGGGSWSLRVDPQGKTFAQRLLQMTINVPKELL